MYQISQNCIVSREMRGGKSEEEVGEKEWLGKEVSGKERFYHTLG